MMKKGEKDDKSSKRDGGMAIKLEGGMIKGEKMDDA